MGARGPKPLPTGIKQARGTFRADRAAGNEAAPLGKPTCPTWVKDKDARAEWRRLTKVLSNMGLVGAADSNLLVRYCIAWVRWRRVVQVLASNSGAEFATFKDSDGKIKSMQISALHSAARSLADELSRGEQQLGMTPSARSRIEVAAPPSATDPTNRFFDDLPPMRMAQ